ncbi:MAG: bifunctional tetrahydrofolate synthase/dihydrofolate synthase [Idiomarina sp.]
MPKPRTLAPAASASLDDWLHYLENLHTKTIELGLDRVSEVADKLGVRQPKVPVITVAGTNGKGSTVRYLEVILQHAGYSTGVYVSPHLYHYAERVRLNQHHLANAEHTQAFAAVDAARGDTSLSYFEFGTLAALWLFQQHQPDVIILEVGLGGRLDAVNCVAPDVAVVTSIGLDHCDWLGDTRELIGFEKAGIFRAGKHAVCGDPEMPVTIGEHAQAIGAALYQVGEQFSYQRHGDTWHYRSETLNLTQLPLPQLPLANAATAIAALEGLALPVTEAAIKQGISEARLAGRLQLLQTNPPVLLDVAHNPHAARFLCDTLQARFKDYDVIAVIGMLADKDIKGSLQALAPVVSEWCLASLSEPRGASAKELQQALPPTSVQVSQHDSVVAAFEYARERAKAASRSTLVLVCGSFYTVGKIQAKE